MSTGSFPYMLQRDCKKPECDDCEDECGMCVSCGPEPKCLQIEHSVIVACTPSHLAALAEKIPMHVAILEPISYTVEIRITNRFTYPISIQHVYSALAASELWGLRKVRQLPVLDEECSTRDVDECGARSGLGSGGGGDATQEPTAPAGGTGGRGRDADDLGGPGGRTGGGPGPALCGASGSRRVRASRIGVGCSTVGPSSPGWRSSCTGLLASSPRG